MEIQKKTETHNSQFEEQDINETKIPQTVLVVGDNPLQLLSKYVEKQLSEPQLIYHLADAEKLLQDKIRLNEKVLAKGNLSAQQQNLFNQIISYLRSITPEEYYRNLTQGLGIDEKGDAYTFSNLDGKIEKYQEPTQYFIPFLRHDGTTCFHCHKGDVDWQKMYMDNAQLFESTWGIIKEGKKPENSQENSILQNKSRLLYVLNQYSSKDEYVNINSSYWTHAYLDENGWHDIDETNSLEWIGNFYKRFIEPLNDTQNITIFEYFKAKFNFF